MVSLTFIHFNLDILKLKFSLVSNSMRSIYSLTSKLVVETDHLTKYLRFSHLKIITEKFNYYRL